MEVWYQVTAVAPSIHLMDIFVVLLQEMRHLMNIGSHFMFSPYYYLNAAGFTALTS